MPQRTNEFQQLVYLLKRQMAGDAVVTESKLLADRISGLATEVDICIEFSKAGHAVVLSLECRDHSRPATVEWVREMQGKHANLPTSALILVSRSGFTKGALLTAAGLGIATMDLQQGDERAVERVVGKAGSLWGKSIQFAPTKVVVTVRRGDTTTERVSVVDDTFVFDASGEYLGTMKESIEPVLHKTETRERFLRDATPEHAYFVIEWEPKPFKGNAACLQWNETKELRPIEHIRVEGTFRCVISEFRLSHGKLGDVSVSWATGRLLDKPAMIVASKPASGAALFTLHFGQAMAKKRRRNKRA